MTVEKVEQIRAFEGCVVPAVVYRADDTPCSRHAGVGKGVEGVGPGRPKRRSRHYPPHVGSWVEKHWAQKTDRLGNPDINVDNRVQWHIGFIEVIYCMRLPSLFSERGLLFSCSVTILVSWGLLGYLDCALLDCLSAWRSMYDTE